MLADGGEEPVEQPGVAALVLGAQFSVQVGEVAFQQRAIDQLDSINTGCGKELSESGDGQHRAPAAGFQAKAA